MVWSPSRQQHGSPRGVAPVLALALGLAAAPQSEAGFYGCSGCHDTHGVLTTLGHEKCQNCHTMHYSENGTTPSGADAGGPFKHLLKTAVSTDGCLQCHYAANTASIVAPVVLTPDGTQGTNFPLAPGGDFYHSKTANDDNNGHNPGGAMIGSDGTLTQAPGGSFQAADETCVSCHEPHKTPAVANSYRALRKKPKGWTGSDLLVSGDGNHMGTDENDTNNRPEYYSGFSQWCGACHSNPDGSGAGFHGSSKSDSDVGDGTDWLRHPTDAALGATLAAAHGTSFAYPYQVEDVNQDDQVDANDEVFCLSCHRAHATEYANATRWDCTQPSGTGTGCNKCHAKGE